MLTGTICFALSLVWAVGCTDDGSGGGEEVDGGVDADAPMDGGVEEDGSSQMDGEVEPDGSAPAAEDCEPLPEPTGTVVDVYPADADQLRDIVSAAGAGDTILLHDGTYDMSGGDSTHRLVFGADGVALRSASGDPEAVVLDGGYVTGELISIMASDVTIAELTLTRAYYHPIHVTGRSDSNVEGTVIYRVRVMDPGEQAIKINPSSAGFYADFGRIECCHIELTDQGRPEIRNNCYTGGVDAHAAWDWVIRLNVILGFWCDTGLSEHGVHMWKTCRGTLVERNHIIDCARGIGFGLLESGTDPRVYPDDPYPSAGFMGHIDGMIRNNFVFAGSSALFSSPNGFDTGIALAQARGAQVYHNTVVSTQPPFSSIEYRFSNTDAIVKNNLMSHDLMARNGAQAETDGNVENTPLDYFADAVAGDLHLDPVAAAPVIDAGVGLTQGLCDHDFDGESREESRDIGADEVVE
jgi:hypothetical protein